MTAIAEAARPPRFALLSFLREELAPRPGRLAAAARVAAGCAVVVAIAMLYRIPLAAYMAYIVFLVSREEAAATLLTGVVGGLAATLAIALSLLFYTLDASEPALRLPLMAGGTFAGMFLVRTMALGPVAFLAGFVLVLSQTLIDEIPTLEGLTRLVLWLWVVVAVPATLTVLVNLVLGESPARLARRAAVRLLGDIAAALRRGTLGSPEHDQAEAVSLVELRQHAGILERDLRHRAATDTALIETLAELLTLLSILPADTPLAARLPLARASEAAVAAFERGAAPSPPRAPDEAVLAALTPRARPVVVALADALARLTAGIARRRKASDPPGPPSVKAMFVPDAVTNPAHLRFALKTTVAVMAAYIIYSGLDWPGISTAITTCFFVALGTLGETMHKLTLRLTGAVIGGLVGGLCIVYLLPAMTDIGQLCLLIAAVAFPCGWVAAGSERLSYAGMQAAFAFFLGVLQGYGPSTDLTGLRDRVVGILLGNFLMSLVFSLFWPVSAADGARAALARALRALARLAAGDGRRKPGSRLAVVEALAEAHRFVSIGPFEPRLLRPRGPDGKDERSPVATMERLAAAAFVVADQRADSGLGDALRAEDEAVAAWFSAAADRLAAGEPVAALPETSPGLDRAMAALPAAPADLRAAAEARLLLRSEIAHAVPG